MCSWSKRRVEYREGVEESDREEGEEENRRKCEEIGYWAECRSEGLIWEEEGYRKEKGRQ